MPLVAVACLAAWARGANVLAQTGFEVRDISAPAVVAVAMLLVLIFGRGRKLRRR